MNKVIFLFFIFLIPTAGIYSQQVWPVQVTGSIIPPHSIDLKVYGNDRSTDLNFQVLLNDPEELALQVIPILTIEQNGNVIYQTDMNYSANPITLNQFSSYLLDGAALNQYLSAEALSGNNGIGKGATLIPEGFTQICLQMYGVDRTVPVSNKFCVSGNFRLNQAPQLIKPSFNDIIKMPPVQNMIFSWIPMHLSSGNNPGAVEYVFELVELPIGVMNANDVFESALKIYSTTVLSTSFIYSQAEPILKPNTYYAWRVSARSILYPTSLLFQNEGKSEISMFILYDGQAPTNEFNPFDKSAPRGCSVYETSYGPINKSDNAPSLLSANQRVKLGYFDMLITEVNGSQEVNSGKGLVDYPMLRSRIPVEFKNIKVNKEGRVYESEIISSKINNELNIPFELINKDNVKNYITQEFTSKVYEQINDQSIVSKLSESNTKINSLPLALSNSNFPNELACVNGVYFNPTNAYLNLVSRNKNGDIYAATGIPSTPYGLKSDAYLVPMHISTNKDRNDKITESIYSGGIAADGSRIFCDCNGYTSIKAKSALSISPEILHQVNSELPITLRSEKAIPNFISYIGKVKLNSAFEIKGLPNYQFNSQNAILDLDQSKEPDIPLPSTSKLKNPNSRGIVINDISVKLPREYNFVNAGKDIMLNNGNIIINDENLESAYLYKKDVLSLKDGKLGPWTYSVDSMILSINNERKQEILFNGEMKAPFFEDKFSYRAKLKDRLVGNDKIIAAVGQSTLKMSMWKAEFETKESSKIEANLIQGEKEMLISPKCSFDGNISIKLSDKQFRDAILNQNKGITIDELKKALKVESLDFDLSNLKIEGLASDPYKEAGKRYEIEKIDKSQTKLKIGTDENKLTDASFVYLSKENSERLGMRLNLVKGQSKVELIVWSKSNNGSLEFEGIEIKTIDQKCNCTAMNVVPTDEEWKKIIQNYYEKSLSARESTGMYKGGLMNAPIYPEHSILNDLKLSLIRQNSISWFPASLDASTIYIPFLNKYLRVEKEGSIYKGVYKHPMYAKPNIDWDKKSYGNSEFENLTNANKDTLTLPLVISEDLWSQFGFKGAYTLPDNFKLYISEFKSSSDKLESAKIKINLVGKLEIDNKNKYVEFSSINEIPIGPNKVSLKDVLLHLIKDTKITDNISFLSSLKDGTPDVSSENGSFARLSCEEGLSTFNLQGDFLSLNQSLCDVYNTKTPKQAINLGFKLSENKIENNQSLLADFIAPLKSTSKIDGEWKQWNFATFEDQHIIFTPNGSFEGYLDFSTTRSETVSTNPKGKLKEFNMDWIDNDGFTGLLFKQVQFTIPALETKRIKESDPTVIFVDTIFNAYYDLSGNSFFATYQAINKVTKDDNARLGGWRYMLDTITWNIEYSALDENKVAMIGSVKMPLFKEAPEKDKEKWLNNYDNPWVGYKINIEYNSADNEPSINGFVNNITDSLFESSHIDNLGFKLAKESNIEFYYEKRSKKLKARAQLHGRGVYTIEKLDAKIPVFKFESLKLNYAVSGLCKGDGMDGIESIEFGTWGIFPFSPQEIAAFKGVANSSTGQSMTNKAKENKFAKSLGNKFNGLSKLAGFEINIHQPKFQCTGNEYKFIIGLDLSITRDKPNLTESQTVAYDQFHPLETAERNKSDEENKLGPIEDEYKKAQDNIRSVANEKKAILEEKKLLSERLDKAIDKRVNKHFNSSKDEVEVAEKVFGSKKFSADWNRNAELHKKLEEVNKKYDKALKEVKEKYKPFKEQKIKIKAAENELDVQTKASVAKAEKNKTLQGRIDNFKSDFKSKLKEAKATKTGAFSAGGDIEVTFTSKGFKDVALTCLGLGGEFGPLKFKGGLNLFRDETNASNFDPNAVQSEWGNGFLGMIELGVLSYEFKTKFQTGVKFRNQNSTGIAEDFRYFFADLSFNANPGIPLDNAAQFSLTGIGGGFYFNMQTVKPKFDDVVKTSPPKANNDHCQVPGLKAGQSLSGMQYEVSYGSFGGYLMAEISHTARVSLENIVSVEASYINGEFKFKQFGIAVNGYALYTDYLSRKESSPVIVKGNFNVNFEKDIVVYGGIDFRLGKKAGPIDIAAPIDKNINSDSWNQIKFMFSKDRNYVHAGSWGVPSFLPFYRSDVRPNSELNFLSAGFDVPLFGKVMAGLYFQGGNYIDGFPTVKTFLPDYKGKIIPNKTDVSPTGTTSGVNAGFILYAKMEGGFLLINYSADGILGANLTVSKVNKANSCNADGSKIGFSNGYYARGNVYASLNADVNLEVDVWLYKGKKNIFNSKMDFVMDFGFPNPGYLQGEFSFSYSVLGGLVSGDETMSFDAGNKPCIVKENNPIVGIKIHNEIYPKDGSMDIANLDTIKVETRLPYLKTYCIEKSGATGALPSDYTRYKIKSFIVREKGNGKILKTVLVLRENENNYQVLIKSRLKYETEYEIAYKYVWEKSIDQQKTFSEVAGSEEEGTSEFTTAEAPEGYITHDMLDYECPGHHQRYWNKEYNIPCLRFNKSYPYDLDKLKKIFPNDKLYLYFAVIKEHKTDGSIVTHRIPVENIPTYDMIGSGSVEENYDIFFNGNRSETREAYHKAFFKNVFDYYGDVERIVGTWDEKESNEYTKLPDPTRVALQSNGLLTFTKINTLPLSKGSLCNMVIYRAISKDENPTDLNALLQQYSDTESKDQVAIYHNSFAISIYDNLEKKLNDIVVSRGLTKQSITESKRYLGEYKYSDLGFSKEDIQTVVDRAIADSVLIMPQNVYIGVNGRKEGFDMFDVQILKAFSRVNIKGELNFAKWNYSKKQSTFDKRSNLSFSQSYGNKFGRYTEEYFVDANKDDSNVFQGRHIDYTIFNNRPDINKYEITEEEIEEGKLLPINRKRIYEGQFIYDENTDFDFIIEDGFQTTRALQFLLIKNVLSKNNPEEFYKMPENEIPSFWAYGSNNNKFDDNFFIRKDKNVSDSYYEFESKNYFFGECNIRILPSSMYNFDFTDIHNRDKGYENLPDINLYYAYDLMQTFKKY